MQTQIGTPESLNELLTSAGIVTKNENVSSILDRFGLNWNVNKEPMYTKRGDELLETGFFGLVRSDNGKCIQSCKKGYEVFQNSEMVELISEAANSIGLQVDKGGEFKGGGLVYLQLETGIVTGLGENRDTVKKYVSAMNSHNGEMSLRWGLTNITISCQNTFWAAVKEMGNTVKHTKSMRMKIEGIIKQIEDTRLQEKTVYETFFKFAEVPAQKKHIELLTRIVLDVDANSNLEELSTYKKNRMSELGAAINAETLQKGQTLLGLFSGVTKYTTHLSPGNADNRGISKANGVNYAIDNEVFQAFAEVVR